MKKIYLLSLLICFLFVSCGTIKSKGKAEEMAKKFYNAIKKKDFKKALSFVGDIGRSNTPIDKWERLLVQINKVNGNLQGYSLGAWGFKTSTGKGTTIKLTISTVYAKKTWKEQLIFFNLPNSDEISITGYKTNYIKKKRKKKKNKKSRD